MQSGLHHIMLRGRQHTPGQALAEYEKTWCHRHDMDIWQAFQRITNGEIKINNTMFYYRIGEYLTMPIEAIIANGEFVRTRPHRRPAIPEAHNGVSGVTFHLPLKRLDPASPNGCLYGGGRVAPTTLRDPHWYFFGRTVGSFTGRIT